jgi:hypothetical protein
MNWYDMLGQMLMRKRLPVTPPFNPNAKGGVVIPVGVIPPGVALPPSSTNPQSGAVLPGNATPQNNGGQQVQTPPLLDSVVNPQKGPWYKDPSLPGMLTTIGAVLGQPRPIGMTGWGQVAQALAQGMAYRQMYKQQQQQAILDALDRWMRMNEAAARTEKMRTESGLLLPSQAEANRAKAEWHRAEAQEAPRRTQADLTRAEAAREGVQVRREEIGSQEKRHAEEMKLKQQELNQQLTRAQEQLKYEQARLREMERHNRASEDIDRQKVRVDALRAKIAEMEAAQKLATGDVKLNDISRLAQAYTAVNESPLLDEDTKRMLSETLQREAAKRNIQLGGAPPQAQQAAPAQGKQAVPPQGQQAPPAQGQQVQVWKLSGTSIPPDVLPKLRVGDIIEANGKRHRITKIEGSRVLAEEM